MIAKSEGTHAGPEETPGGLQLGLELERQTEVLTYHQFCARRGYDVDPSHDRFRFPNGISKRQARDNRRAAAHHLGEALRAAADYGEALRAGEVRGPTESEAQLERLMAHPDHDSTRAAWRVAVKRGLVRQPGLGAEAVAAGIIHRVFGETDAWKGEMPAGHASAAGARLAWAFGHLPIGIFEP